MSPTAQTVTFALSALEKPVIARLLAEIHAASTWPDIWAALAVDGLSVVLPRDKAEDFREWLLEAAATRMQAPDIETRREGQALGRAATAIGAALSA